MADALGTPGPPAGPGVVSALDHRLDQAGLIAPQGAGMAVRTGVMVGPGTTTLVTGTSATGTMTYAIAAHHWVSTRGTADGVYLGATEAAQTVSTTAAPGANSRIDVIWEKQQDQYSTLSADATSAPQWGVTQGTALVSPVKPAIPVGALELATAVVAAGATSTNGSGVTITNTVRQTVARGAPIPVRTQAERDALPAYPGLRCIRLDRGGDEELYRDGAWRGTRILAYSAVPLNSAVGFTAANNTLRQIAIPDPGYPYRLLVNGMTWALVSPGSVWNLLVRLDNNATGTLIRPVGEARSTTYAPVSVQNGLSDVLTGTHTVLFCAARISGLTGDGFQVTTEPNVQSYTVQVIPE